MIHPKATAHFRELAGELSSEHPLNDKLERLQMLLLAALDCAYAAAEKNSRLLGRIAEQRSTIAELQQTVVWQRAAIDELDQDRQLLLTVIEEAVCMPPLFTYCRRPAAALP